MDEEHICARAREARALADFKANPCTITTEQSEALKTANFNCWRAGADSARLLRLLFYMIMETSQALPQPSCSTRLVSFLARVYTNYNDNPYHNFLHCFCVTQMMYHMLCTIEKDTLSPLERYSLVLAAVCHDLDHPGLSNGYQITSHTNLATKYPFSPLENHHVHVALSIISDVQSDVLFGLSIKDREFVRESLVELILATDMDRMHTKLLAEFSAAADTLDLKVVKNRRLLMKMMLKACDISNEGRPWPLSYRWGLLVMQEFLAEGDLRREKGLNIPPHMDRHRFAGPRSQLGFLKFVALPLYTAVTQVVGCHDLMTNAKSNIRFYQLLADADSSTDQKILDYVDHVSDMVHTQAYYVTNPQYPALEVTLEPPSSPEPPPHTFSYKSAMTPPNSSPPPNRTPVRSPTANPKTSTDTCSKADLVSKLAPEDKMKVLVNSTSCPNSPGLRSLPWSAKEGGQRQSLGSLLGEFLPKKPSKDGRNSGKNDGKTNCAFRSLSMDDGLWLRERPGSGGAGSEWEYSSGSSTSQRKGSRVSRVLSEIFGSRRKGSLTPQVNVTA